MPEESNIVASLISAIIIITIIIGILALLWSMPPFLKIILFGALIYGYYKRHPI